MGEKWVRDGSVSHGWEMGERWPMGERWVSDGWEMGESWVIDGSVMCEKWLRDGISPDSLPFLTHHLFIFHPLAFSHPSLTNLFFVIVTNFVTKKKFWGDSNFFLKVRAKKYIKNWKKNLFNFCDWLSTNSDKEVIF